MPVSIDLPVFPVVAANATVVAHGASGTLTAADVGKIHTNTGAGDTIAPVLPPAATCPGQSLKVQLTVAEDVNLTPVSGESIFLGGSGVASKYLSIPGVIGNYCNLSCDGSRWLVTDYAGALVKEA